MTTILGVSAFYHDSAVCLVRDGHIVAAAQEERFSRRVGDASLPVGAAAACLTTAGLAAQDVDALVFYEKPLLKLERLLQNHLDVAPRGVWQWRMLARRLWHEKLNTEASLRRLLPGFAGVVEFVEHHEAHAASAFFPSPFAEAAILTVDGVGEWATASWGEGRDADITLREEMQWPDSLGLLYSAVTSALGFRVNRDEYKVMGLAAYGQPRFVDWINQHLVVRHADGSCRLRQELLAYRFERTMVRRAFAEALGVPLRTAAGELTDAARDLASSIQLVLEEQMLAMATYVHRRTGAEALCLAGGVAYNCVANSRLRAEGPFKHLWIQPAAGDAGGAIGAAMLGYFRGSRAATRVPSTPDGMRFGFLGPDITREEALSSVTRFGLAAQEIAPTVAHDIVARALADGQIVAIATGPMEFGPRALGNRSILADPRQPGVQERLNRMIKHRESFRPFAPVVLAERQGEVFDRVSPSYYMLETSQARATSGWRDQISGAVHIDGSSRLQTVPKDHPSVLRSILERFESLTSCPVLINTSFNDADVPMPASAADACEAMLRTNVTLMLLGGAIVTRRPDGLCITPIRERMSARTALATLKRLSTVPARLFADALLTGCFYLVVVPLSFLRYLTNGRARLMRREDSTWRVRERSRSDLSRLF